MPSASSTVDHDAAVLLAEAARRAHAHRYVLISSAGVESVRGKTAQDDEEVFTTYLRAKLAAEDAVRATDLEWTVLRPGHLTDDPPTGRVRLEPGAEDGSVPRADVAAVVAALADRAADGRAGRRPGVGRRPRPGRRRRADPFLVTPAHRSRVGTAGQ